ncbi:protein of unknown function [Duganella sp. CF458]|uniref:hypothetical protein n=1 Tax=Duganella sp. CF458 TaxID=1884368 RepID=UPI0008E87CCA|nr:hypothetical protein [Duganella sp. CF458]SFF74292.1 protein of unknown function [Duganella sp. CF458]
MSKIQNASVAAPIIQVQVVATPSVDPKTQKVKYDTTFTPESIKVTEPDTILSYQLVAPTPAGVQFKSLKVKGKVPEQISPPTISQSGKLMVMTDANTFKEVLNLTIKFKDSDALEFDVDPEVANDPGQFELGDGPIAMVMLEPEQGNDPGQ